MHIEDTERLVIEIKILLYCTWQRGAVESNKIICLPSSDKDDLRNMISRIVSCSEKVFKVTSTTMIFLEYSKYYIA